MARGQLITYHSDSSDIVEYDFKYGGIVQDMSLTDSGNSRIPLIQIVTDNDDVLTVGNVGDEVGDFQDLGASDAPSLPLYIPQRGKVRVWATSDPSAIIVETMVI